MILDRILLRLTEPLESREDASVLGRMGFLEWLVSVPEDSDFSRQAELAYERAAPLKVAVPAIRVLCDLLKEAASNPAANDETPDRKSVRACRRIGSSQRRHLH